MNSMTHEAVIIKARSRFAVIGPGKPSPIVIVSSGSDIDDFIGYFSVREAGLAGAVEIKQKKISNATILMSSMLGLATRADEDGFQYYSIDLWHQESGASREEMFSLVFDKKGIGSRIPDLLKDYESALLSQLSRLVDAYSRSDADEIQYIGQMLSTFVGLLENRLVHANERNKRRQKLIQYAADVHEPLAGVDLAILLGESHHLRAITA